MDENRDGPTGPNQEAVRQEQERVNQAVDERQNLRGEDPKGERERHADDPRPPRPLPGAQRLHPNVPDERYRPNPANSTQELPPERQAPRPADPAHIGTGANKAGIAAGEQPEPARQPGFPTGPQRRDAE